MSAHTSKLHTHKMMPHMFTHVCTWTHFSICPMNCCTSCSELGNNSPTRALCKLLELIENGKQLQVRLLQRWQRHRAKVTQKACGNSFGRAISVCPVTPPIVHRWHQHPTQTQAGSEFGPPTLTPGANTWPPNVTLGPEAKTMRWNNKVPRAHCVWVWQ